MLLYPKWPAIGITLFHAFFMCGLLTLVIVEWDRQRLKPWHDLALIGVFAIFALCFPFMQPVPVDENLPFVVSLESPVMAQAAKVVVGLVCGLVLGYLTGLLAFGGHWRVTSIAFVLTGIVVGWQGLVQVAVVFFVLLLCSYLAPRIRTRIATKPTSLLLVAVMLHHPFWKFILGWW